MKYTKQHILWLDCIGALIAGLFVLIIRNPLSKWDGLPVTVVIGIGVANLIYGAYSTFVTTKRPRPIMLVKILAVANMLWLAVCIAIASLNRESITLFGMIHVIGEGIYVAMLGFTEWKWRKSLGQ